MSAPTTPSASATEWGGNSSMQLLGPAPAPVDTVFAAALQTIAATATRLRDAGHGHAADAICTAIALHTPRHLRRDQPGDFL